MALAQVTIMANQVESARIGHQSISLTHFGDNLEPAIASGSIVEVGGALYEAPTDEAISGLGAIANDSNIYIKLTASGGLASASGTLVAPTWDTAKQGWYNGAERYIGGLHKDGSGNYTLKWLYEHVGNSNLKLFGDGTIAIWEGLGFLAKKIIEIGDWDMDANIAKAVASGIPLGKIRNVNALIRGDVGGTYENYRLPLTAQTAGVSQLDGGAVGAFDLTGLINLRRTAGGVFDSANFDATGFNRGWVTVEYEV